MPDLVVDGDFTEAEAIGSPVLTAPLDGVAANYVLTQEYVQNADNFVELPLSTPHPDRPEYVLVEEGEKSDAGLGLVRWIRTYARVPDAYSRPGGNMAYTFPGFYGAFGVNVTTITGRDSKTKNVPVRIQSDFFLIGPDQTYTTFAAIPVNHAQRFYYGSNPNLDVTLLADSPPFTEASTPSRSDYEDMIDDEEEIVAEDSVVDRWMGNIYIRETRYVKVQ